MLVVLSAQSWHFMSQSYPLVPGSYSHVWSEKNHSGWKSLKNVSFHKIESEASWLVEMRFFERKKARIRSTLRWEMRLFLGKFQTLWAKLDFIHKLDVNMLWKSPWFFYFSKSSSPTNSDTQTTKKSARGRKRRDKGCTETNWKFYTSISTEKTLWRKKSVSRFFVVWKIWKFPFWNYRLCYLGGPKCEIDRVSIFCALT